MQNRVERLKAERDPLALRPRIDDLDVIHVEDELS